MSGIQRFFMRIFPRAWAADMEAESRTWMIRCPCGYEQSIWEIGGIRWKAVGNPRSFRRCIQCGKRSWHTIYRKAA